jgi:DNA-binding transcriptional LysR family regulator
MIDLRHFRQFIAVAETMNFHRAAERLHMAQPPLTVSIKKIETELGVSLFERGNRITRLTEAGAVFLDEARRAVMQAERAVTEARRAGVGLAGTLRVTFVASAAHDLLPRILRRFRRRHAGVALELREATTTQQVEALRDDLADIGLVVAPILDAPELAIEVIDRDRLVAALPEGHKLAMQEERLALADLAEEPFVLFPARQGPGLYARIAIACGQARFAPRVAQEALQMETIAGLVAGGIGVSLVPASLAALGRPGVVFREVGGSGTPIVYELAAAARIERASPLVAAFAETARRAAREAARQRQFR